MTFSDYVQQWQQNVLPLMKPASRATIKSNLALLLRAFSGQPLELDYQAVQKFFTEHARTHAPKTSRNVYTSLHLVLASAVREGLITKIPKPTLPKSTRTEQEWLSVVQLRAVIADSNPTYRPLYATLAETGLRIGEALGLKGSDFNEADKTITVARSLYAGQEQTPKSAAAYRTITLSAYLVDILRPLALANPEGFLFRSTNGSPLWPEKILVNSLHPLLADLKLKRSGFHAWRRGNCTIMCSILGVPEKIAAYRLGHRAPGLTLGLYAQSFTGIDKEWAPKIGEALFK